MPSVVVMAAVALLATAHRPAIPPAEFERRVVALHDAERAKVGSPPIAWDDRLSRDAAVWADRLAGMGAFLHDPANASEGENLWMGTRGAYALDDMVDAWSDERRELARLRSWDDDPHGVGHYTQMVWAGTSRVGCAVAANRSDEFLVCRYDPPGNYLGESPWPARR